ncbi:hypothetical protein CVV26_02865 [Candidatus Kuenenbacteria bacterium HGW-Kuenenbacteria-1]|uniref:Uncharacterized protein n=1 Tax=Candidatus Kuenenbacteria bacterium HGW-Kuenenbacteria-1 TaxID=2013812 RepID=A0A2N1UN41_9BACT|nr:MAG: hypothetical protein CVV26_02865 [Candidatus Kuenenbacteria bacterium HGW-Kuenenbacteria-1]
MSEGKQQEDVEDIFSSTEVHKESNIFKEMEPKELPKEEEISEASKVSLKFFNQEKMKVFIIGIIVIILLFLGIYVIYFKIKNIREERKILEKEKNANDILSQIKTVEQVIDSDADGLSDDEEAQLGTDALEVDSDKDGLSDRAEVKVWKTDPLKPDTDADGIKDGDELKKKTNPKGEGSLLETIQK